MRVYIAASLPDRADAAALAVALRERGHTVTSAWHDDASATPENEARLPMSERLAIATRNIAGIDASDCLVVLNERPTERVGKWIETAHAFGTNMRIVLIGNAPVPLMVEPMIFLRHPSVTSFLEPSR